MQDNQSSRGTLRAICLSASRGIAKSETNRIRLIENYGLENDAHAGTWHRQVSILCLEEIENFRARGAEVRFGDFGENLIIDGINLKDYPVGTRIRIADALLETTQIGKKCHHHCKIFHRMGDCIMPRCGVFARVLSSGTVTVGAPVQVTFIPQYSFTAAVVTLSDKGFRGEREDRSGAAAERILKENSYMVLERVLLPDDREMIEKELLRLSDERHADLIITTGGTGFSLRDVTPEATMAVATRNAPGIAEYIRSESFKITSRAMLSRAVSVIRNNTLIINLPGSEKAVTECMQMIMEPLQHGLGILLGREKECGNLKIQ